ncbi:hypothetical protein JYG23_11340 [Sedimentibacter sp. zth1]|uniref:tyrosine-protein phosphatase n=1 Tax=Sedimentibacter sp. zth1 TaxID=2816908 RepID=UPI001A938591|nr:CpsB/CapC family capsule biosynthesis tyrosine phosphatase [Sedimentibacter sp. zth1]QSX05265.1 hypothetical protein JYG23_11340 [Sedimentibacter sp. zth1]
MIDIHTHLLHDIDDGASTCEIALQMIKMERNQGVTTVICTPHLNKGELSASIYDINKSYNVLMQKIEENGINIKVLLGHEINCQDNIFEILKSSNFLTMAGSKYIMLELDNNLLNDIENMLYEIKLMGYIPILAHIERYTKLFERKKMLGIIVDEGAHLQINADSILSKHNNTEVKFCKYLLKNRLVSFVASDCHNLNDRKPNLKVCYKYLSSKYGVKYAYELLYDNPDKVINNVPIPYKNPVKKII